MINASAYPCKLVAGRIVGDAAPVIDCKSMQVGQVSETGEQENFCAAESEEATTDSAKSESCVDPLKSVYDSLPQELTEVERQVAKEFIRSQAQVFSQHE